MWESRWTKTQKGANIKELVGGIKNGGDTEGGAGRGGGSFFNQWTPWKRGGAWGKNRASAQPRCRNKTHPINDTEKSRT